jgi:hypothetical protein
MIKGFTPVPRASPYLRYTLKQREDMGKQAAKVISFNAEIRELRKTKNSSDMYRSYILEERRDEVLSNLMKLGLNLEEIADTIEYEKEYQKSLK